METLAKQLSLLRLGFSQYEIDQELLHKMPSSPIIFGNFHHGAYIFEQKGNSFNILSRGINYLSSNKSVHAENDAIHRLKPRKHKKKKKINMLIIRTTKLGKLGSSQPCYHCTLQLMDLIPSLGYKLNYIIYTNKDETMTKIKFNKFIQSEEFHISGFYRKKKT